MDTLTTALFLSTFTNCVMAIIYYIVVIFRGEAIGMGLPILHIFDITFINIYVLAPSITYQAYFWFTYAGVLS